MSGTNPIKVLFVSHGALFSNSGYRRRVVKELKSISGWPGITGRIDLTLLSFVALPAFSLKKAARLKAYALERGFRALQPVTAPLAGSGFLLIVNVLFGCVLSSVVAAGLKIKIIHAQNLVAGFIGALVKKILPSGVSLIFDYHGVVPEEFREFFPDKRAGYRLRKMMETFTIRSADHVVCVSNAFKKYLTENFAVSPGRISVIPSCVNSSFLQNDIRRRSKYKRKLGVEHRTVLVYSGNIGQWHSEDLVLKVCKTIVQGFSDVLFLFLIAESASKEKLAQKIAASGFHQKSYKVLNLKHEDVKYFLAASDVALLVRKKSIVNFVASPTKFSEYLAAGLPVLLSPGIGDTEKVAKDHSVGVVCDEQDKDRILHAFETVLALSKDDSTGPRCMKVALESFNWDICGKHLLHTYASLSRP